MDEKYAEAVALCKEKGRANWVLLQRQLGLSIARADAVLDRMVVEGIITPAVRPKSHQLCS